MKIFVTAKVGTKENRCEQIDASHFRVMVKTRPTDGKANAAIARLLADHFHLPITCVQLKSGASSKNKTFEVLI